MRTRRIKLNPNDNLLRGNFKPGEDAIAMCDATLSSFSVQMPSAKLSDDTIFHLVREDTNGDNLVTFTTVDNETINNESTQCLRVGDVVILRSDGNNWW